MALFSRDYKEFESKNMLEENASKSDFSCFHIIRD